MTDYDMLEVIYTDTSRDYSGPSYFFGVACTVNLCIDIISFVFVCLTAQDKCVDKLKWLPRMSLSIRDPIVKSLLGSIFFAGCCAVSGQISLYFRKPTVCYWTFKLSSTLYVFSYYFLNLFLLAKLRAVDAGLVDKWYLKFQRTVTLVTYFGMPLFAVVVAIFTQGRPVLGKYNSYFCLNHAPWFITVTFAILQCFGALAYLLMFTLPLVTTKKQVVAALSLNSDRGRKLHAVIVRNLISCILSVGMTFISMASITIANRYQNLYPGSWTISLAYIDLTVNIGALMYAINPAWRADSAGSGRGRRKTSKFFPPGANGRSSAIVLRSSMIDARTAASTAASTGPSSGGASSGLNSNQNSPLQTPLPLAERLALAERDKDSGDNSNDNSARASKVDSLRNDHHQQLNNNDSVHLRDREEADRDRYAAVPHHHHHHYYRQQPSSSEPNHSPQISHQSSVLQAGDVSSSIIIIADDLTLPPMSPPSSSSPMTHSSRSSPANQTASKSKQSIDLVVIR